MKLVIIESPYAGNVSLHVEYARECMLDSLDRGEAPLASHLLYTQMLNDNDPTDRKLGIEAGLAWGAKAELTALYLDHGQSRGMTIGKLRAIDEGRAIEQRNLYKNCLTCKADTIASARTAKRNGWIHSAPAWICPVCNSKQ